MPLMDAVIAALVKIVAAVGFIMVAVPMTVWLERKVVADMQARVGPNRVGPFGLLQCFADGIKLVMKEGVVPREVDRLLYFLAPVLVMIPALSVAAVVPFAGDLRIMGHLHAMVIADLPIGLLFILALTSLSVYGIVLSGWSSNNKYSLLGGLRSAAQMVSYELPMGLSLVSGLMIVSWASPGGFMDLSLRRVVELQDGGFWNWTALNPRFALLGLLAAVSFYVCGLAETNRAPFDLPEAETELVGGYHTEYGGLRFALFFLGEYAAMINIGAVTSAVFLGGWHSPYPDAFLGRGSLLYFLHGLAWFGFKVFAILILYIWIRGTLPRLRYDRLMSFSWKIMLPTTLVNVMLVATLLSIFHPLPAPAILSLNQNDAQPIPGAAPGAPAMPPPPAGAITPGGPAPTRPPGAAPGGLTLPGGLSLPGGTPPGGAAPGAPAPGGGR